ncbi:MAG: type I glutamate--ammonia ligase [Myxococcales bacterium]|nr:type I glutamate--ammonia ligase [Myxococcales bacterium]
MADPTLQSLQKLAQDHGIRMIDVRYADLAGAWHHVTLPVAKLDERLLEEGVAFDSSSVAGFKRVEGGDMVVVPDPATAAIEPFFSTPTLAMIGSLREADTLAPYARDPRTIAARAEALLRSFGPADRSLWSPEFEFYVFDHITSSNTNNRAAYEIDSDTGHWRTGDEQPRHLGLRVPYQGGYHLMPPLDDLHDLRSSMCLAIEEAGIPVKYHHHEVGGAGQCEIEIGFLPLLAAGDAVMTIKYLIRMVARKHNRIATFMPKPLINEAGSGMHFHQMLFSGAKPAFFDEKGHAMLSDLARSYIAGLLRHAPALLAITNPSSNSYRRLTTGFEAPTRLFYGLANRSAAVRIPKQARRPEEKRIEFRCPDGTCNPYLALAAQLLAGLDGIRHKLDPAALGFGPYDFNVFKLPEAEREKIRSAPGSLEEALQALEADCAFLLPGQVFPEDFVPTWTKLLREKGVEPMKRRTHPYEIELYFDV